ncbi:MAG TPA: hypothetical protein VN787_00280 [Steroidobacteraceae bacterium]|nr:hypothetical protein [Steroidobacteraceae bacterium]
MTRLIQQLTSGLVLALAAAAAAAADAPVDGTWQKHEYMLGYAGATSHYSCDGLEYKLTQLLKLAGARPDAKVRASCTNRLGSASRIVTARTTFYTLTLTPAAGSQQSAVPDRRAGTWKTIEWHTGSPPQLTFGDCELVDQFAREMLPMFTTRDVDNRMKCVPYQETLGNIDLRFSVLTALPRA